MAWNYLIHISEEHKRKIGLANKGRISWRKGKEINGKYIFCKQCKNKFYVSFSRLNKSKFCLRKCYAVFLAGKKLSTEQRIKMSESHKKQWENGFKGSTGIRWKKTEGQILRGDKNPAWKGGITPINHKIRTSLEMDDWRKTCLKRDDYRCFDCSERGGRLEVDHVYPFSLFPHLRTDINNGQTVCKECHKMRTKIFLQGYSKGLFQGRPLEDFKIRKEVYAN